MSFPIAMLYTSAGALEAAVTSGSAVDLATTLGSSLAANGSAGSYVGAELWVFCATVASWLAQGASPTASAGAGSILVPAGVQVLIDGSNGSTLSVIADSGSGHASLARVLLR